MVVKTVMWPEIYGRERRMVSVPPREGQEWRSAEDGSCFLCIPMDI